MISTDHLALFSESDGISDWNINNTTSKNNTESPLPDVYNTQLPSLSTSHKLKSFNSQISEPSRDVSRKNAPYLLNKEISQNDSLHTEQLLSQNPNTFLAFHDKSADFYEVNSSLNSLSSDDIIILGDFCQFVGPKPIIACPSKPPLDSSNSRDWNEYIDQLVSQNMTSDFQMMENRNLFAVSRPSNVLLKDANSPCFVHYFTLYDVQARGYVRSYCLIFHSHDKQKLSKCHLNLCDDCSNFTKELIKENFNQFIQDLHQRRENLLIVLNCLELVFSDDDDYLKKFDKNRLLEILWRNFKKCVDIPFEKSSIRDFKKRINVIESVTSVVKEYMTKNHYPIADHSSTEFQHFNTEELCKCLQESMNCMKPASVLQPLRTIYELTNSTEERLTQSLKDIRKTYCSIKVRSLHLFDDDPYELLPMHHLYPPCKSDSMIPEELAAPAKSSLLDVQSIGFDSSELAYYLSVAYFLPALSSVSQICDDSDDCSYENTTSVILGHKKWSIRPSWPLNPAPTHPVFESQLSAPAHLTIPPNQSQTFSALSREFYCSHLPSASSTSFESVRSTDSFQSAAYCGDDNHWSVEYKNQKNGPLNSLPSSIDEEFFSEASETFSQRPTSRGIAGTLVQKSVKRLSKKLSTKQKETYEAYEKINKKGMFLNPLLYRNCVDALREMIALVGLSVSINIIATVLSRRRMIFTAQTPQQCEFLIRAVRIFLIPNDAMINSWMKVFPDLLELLPYAIVGVRRSEKMNLSCLPRHLKNFASLYDMKSNAFYGPTYEKGVLFTALSRRRFTVKTGDFYQRLVMNILDEYVKGVFMMLSVFQDSRKKLSIKKLLRLGYSLEDIAIMENIMNFVLQCFSNQGSLLKEFISSSLFTHPITNITNL